MTSLRILLLAILGTFVLLSAPAWAPYPAQIRSLRPPSYEDPTLLTRPKKKAVRRRHGVGVGGASLSSRGGDVAVEEGVGLSPSRYESFIQGILRCTTTDALDEAQEKRGIIFDSFTRDEMARLRQEALQYKERHTYEEVQRRLSELSTKALGAEQTHHSKQLELVADEIGKMKLQYGSPMRDHFLLEGITTLKDILAVPQGGETTRETISEIQREADDVIRKLADEYKEISRLEDRRRELFDKLASERETTKRKRDYGSTTMRGAEETRGGDYQDDLAARRAKMDVEDKAALDDLTERLAKADVNSNNNNNAEEETTKEEVYQDDLAARLAKVNVNDRAEDDEDQGSIGAKRSKTKHTPLPPRPHFLASSPPSFPHPW